MYAKRPVRYLLIIFICLVFAQFLWPVEAAAASDPIAETHAIANGTLSNESCLACHDGEKELLVPDTTEDKEDEMRPLLAIEPAKYSKGLHNKMNCIDCHKEITDSKAEHTKNNTPKPNCITCHETLWDEVRQYDMTRDKTRFGKVVENIQAYKESFHANPASTRSGFKAYCDDCHDTHFFHVPAPDTPERDEWRLSIPQVCGESCHDDALEEYVTSVHGVEIVEEKNPKAAVCVDCHTSHDISKTTRDPFQLLVTKQCGSCHETEFISYRNTYHGQINTLGYAYTAKCYDCHGSHELFAVDNEDSTINPKNRLETCQECHDGKKIPLATAGFVTFGPHAHAGDRERYPQMWYASRFMLALLIGVFLFFWAHSILWYYREWQDRKAGKKVAIVNTQDLGLESIKFVKRFPAGWRIAHLIFAIVTMMLVLTGITALYASSSWAPVVAKLFGGPQVVGLVHRVSATIFISIFFLHFVYVMQHLLRKPDFKWFGPDSLVPNWKDLTDCWEMFKWFVGAGEKPRFDRWAYFEKFDYWAVFWGVTIIGGSGLMLAFPHIIAEHFPGWIFNVATLVHGEEAFLAAVFLFTVHFFNNHFRPDKLPPPDIVMFTGCQTLEEFKRDHSLHYERLVKAGELEKYLVDAPSKPMTIGSKILGLVLIAIGLALLTIVAIGFFGE